MLIPYFLLSSWPMKPFCELSLEDLSAWMVEKGEKPFAAKQVFEWVYQKLVFDFSQMSNVKKSLREKLQQEFTLPLLKQKRMLTSTDQETEKFLWELPDGKLVESVLIMSGARRTVCVSSQVGCPARCAFCASGKEGLFRNLGKAEILEQILLIQKHLEAKDERVSHIVFMGMGEPLENYDTVVSTVKSLISPSCFGLSSRRITVSTVGIPEKIIRLAEEEMKVNLVLSLHAPNQHIRKKIIPYARKYELHELLTAMDYYFTKTKRDITFEYTLLAGINDQPEHAEELAALLKDKQCTVNLIPYNPVEGLNLDRPEKETIEAFRDKLEKKNICTTWRYTKGKDIAAACGQLALQTPQKLALVDTQTT